MSPIVVTCHIFQVSCEIAHWLRDPLQKILEQSLRGGSRLLQTRFHLGSFFIIRLNSFLEFSLHGIQTQLVLLVDVDSDVQNISFERLESGVNFIHCLLKTFVGFVALEIGVKESLNIRLGGFAASEMIPIKLICVLVGSFDIVDGTVVYLWGLRKRIESDEQMAPKLKTTIQVKNLRLPDCIQRQPGTDVHPLLSLLMFFASWEKDMMRKKIMHHCHRLVRFFRVIRSSFERRRKQFQDRD